MATIAFHDPRLAHVAGGGEQTTLLLAKWLAEAGHDITIVTRADPSSPLLRDTVAGCPAIRLETLFAPTVVENPIPDASVTREEQIALAHSDRAVYGFSCLQHRGSSLLRDQAIRSDRCVVCAGHLRSL